MGQLREGIIYLVTNNSNGKKYIGQTTVGLSKRWNQHKGDSRKGSGNSLHRAIRKYGEASFTIETIAESLSPFLNTLEQFYVRLYCTHVRQHGYNMTAGGEGVYGWLPSDETKKRMSDSQRDPEKVYEEPVSLLAAFGRRLQQLRTDRGLTQTQLADMVGTGRTHLSETENGLRGSQLETIDSYAKALGVTLEQLFQGL